MHYLSDFDVPGSGWADHYEAQPYGNFKYEVYPMMVAMIATLADGAQVLDIGAGTGHLAAEFVRTHPGRRLAFTLLDNSSAMLAIAARKLAGLGCTPPARMIHRSSFTGQGLDGIGRFHLIASNNTPYPTDPRALVAYYRRMAEHLEPGGAILVQQPFLLDQGGSIYGQHPFMRFLAITCPQLLENPMISASPGECQGGRETSASGGHGGGHRGRGYDRGTAGRVGIHHRAGASGRVAGPGIDRDHDLAEAEFCGDSRGFSGGEIVWGLMPVLVA